MSADLAAPIRTALIGSAEITNQLEGYKVSYPVFTRRPAPLDAPPIMIMVSPNVAKADQDGIDDERPIIVRDVAVYGPNEPAENYRKVESIAFAVHDLFHRQRTAITVSGWYVVMITATGPIPAPTDDDKTVGRVVSLTIMLARL